MGLNMTGTTHINHDSLIYYLEPISFLFDDSEISEICISEGLVFAEKDNEWLKIEVKEFDKDKLFNIAHVIASDANQHIDEEHPILSAQLETGERIQVVFPPAATAVNITIRKPSNITFSLDDLHRMGVFSDTIATESHSINNNDKLLLNLLKKKRLVEFFIQAILSKKNIIVSGPTGSGKITFMKSLVQYIPLQERIITIEDVQELIIPHENKVHLLYSKGGQSVANVTPKNLLESCLRMRPDRILLAELRGEEAFYYIRNVNSGHPGSITSIHANSPRMAFDQLMLYIKESEAGRNLDRADIIKLLHLLVDIVVQFDRDATGQRKVTEIYFDPENKAKLMNVD